MSQLKKGDRVAYYGSVGREVYKVIDDVVREDGTIIVGSDSSDWFSAHPKQLRKIKVYREWWINEAEMREKCFYKGDPGIHDWDIWFECRGGGFIRTTPPADKTGWIYVRESKFVETTK